MSNEDDEFTRGMKADLRRMVDETSPEVRARLNRMVDVAMQGRPPARSPVRRIAWPLGAIAASAAAITLAVIQLRQDAAPPPAAQAPSTPADDVALLLNVDNLDLLERMEFYLWLDRQPGLLPGILERESDAAPAALPRAPQRS